MSDDPRRVHLEPAWTLHGFQHQMLSLPPAGYEFIQSGKPQEMLFGALAQHSKARSLLISLDEACPTMLAKSWLQRWSKPPPGTALTYSVDHLIFRSEPWVVEVEYASALVGIHPKHLSRFKGIVERTLASRDCRRILFWSEAGRRSLLADLHTWCFEQKCEIVHLAVPARAFAKGSESSGIRLLFVGSGSSQGAFEWRGSGLFEVFTILRQHYPNLELVVRSDVPDYLKARYDGVENLRIIDKYVPQSVLEREFQSADIFVFPSYTTAPLAIIEAMSYELPTVTVDAWANSEYVKDGETGLVVPRSKKVPYYYAGSFQPNFAAPEFAEALRMPDPDVVSELVRKVRLLVENSELRKRMGKAARKEVEEGRFSLATMNGKLKQVFDEIVAGNETKFDH